MFKTLSSIVLALSTLTSAFGAVVTETFSSGTADGWVLNGTGYTPTLTSGNADPTNAGWLRLTNLNTFTATSAYYDTAFNAQNATIYASFEYVSWGGSGADGITFFLFDGSTSFNVGADGGSLGYAQKTGVNGLAGAYLGIAVDEFGNFSNPTEGRTGGPGFFQDSFAVRGPGSGELGYDYLGGTATLSTSIDSPGALTRPTTVSTVQLLISSTNQLTLTLQQGLSPTETLLTLDLSGYARPETLKYGFSSGSGSSTNYHEVRNLNVSTLVANLWDNNAGTGLWGTGANWDPNIQPSAGADILFNNTHVSTAQTIDTQTNRTVRSIMIDAPFAYTINNNTITFNAGGVPGFSGIDISDTRGVATHVINSNLSLNNDITIRNTSASQLNLNGTTSLNANDLQFAGSGQTTVNNTISGTGAISKIDSGKVILNTANTYTGGTAVSGGTLTVNNNTALGTGTVVLNGGALNSTSAASLSNSVVLSGSSALSNIALTNTVTQAGSHTLTVDNATLNNISLSNSTTAQTLTFNTNTTGTVSGVISNGSATSGNVVKVGTGELTLSGANTYTGSTTISEGSVKLGASNVLANTSSVNINGGTLNLNGFSEQVGTLSFTNGSLDFGPTGINNSLLFSNLSTSSSGVLTISNWETGDTLASSTALTSTQLAQLYFVGYGSGAGQTGATSVSGYGSGWRPITPTTTGWYTWDSGAGNNRWDRGANWNPNLTNSWVSNSSTKVAFGTGSQTTVDMRDNRTINAMRFDAGSASFNISSSTSTLTFSSPVTGGVAFVQQLSSNNQTLSMQTVSLSTNTVFDVVGTGDLIVSANLTGAGNLVKESSGDLVLSGTNSSYTGSIFINDGTLVATSSTALGNTTGTTTVYSGATLEVRNSITSGENISIQGTGVSNTGAIYSSSGNNVLTGTVTLANDATLNVATGSLTTGNISSTNNNLTLTGNGTTNLTGVIGLGTGELVINNTATTISGSSANTSTGLTKVNSGTLTLSKTAGNAIAGDLVIGDGTGTDTVILGNSNQIADGALVTLSSSGTLNLNNNTETVASISGTGGSVALGSGTLNIAGSDSTAYSGSISGSGTVNKTGTGKLTLSGSSSTFSGPVNLSSGIIQATGSSSNILGTGTVNVTGTGNLELQGGVTLANTMNLNSYGTGAQDGAIQNVTGNNNVTGTVNLTGNSRIQSDSGTLTVAGPVNLGANTLNVTGNGATSITGVIAGTGGLTKEGSGSLTLSNANTFSGPTTISAGVLIANASNVFSNSTLVSVGTAGTLDLNEFSTSVASLSGSGTVDFGNSSVLTLSAGESVFSGSLLGSGTLVVSLGTTFTLGADIDASNLNIILAGGTLKLNNYNASLGSLTITGNSIIDFAGADSTLNVGTLDVNSHTLSIQNWVDTLTYFYAQSFVDNTHNANGTAPSNQVVFSGYSGANTSWKSWDNQVSPVPEPSTYGFFLMGSTVIFMVIRRKHYRKNAARGC